jgi:hypothetical protein
MARRVRSADTGRGLWTADCGLCNADRGRGVRSTRHGVWGMECGIQTAKYGVRSMECGYGVRSAEYGYGARRSMSM